MNRNGQTIGPCLTDAVFFSRCLDCRLPGLEAIPEATAAGDFAKCRKLFGAYVRGSLDVDAFFRSFPANRTEPKRDVLLAAADRASRNVLSSVGTPFDFGEGPVDWYSNPTFNKYPEWTWQLSRHQDILNLAQAYRLTGEERYAASGVRLLESWIRQAVVQEKPNDSLCWRTIECGIRMSLVWPEILHSLCGSDACSDDFLTDFYKSVWEHGDILSRLSTVGNWLIMEMSGLWHIGVLCPCLKQANEWFDMARRKMVEELYVQVYPDGFQNELSTGYHQTLIGHYARNMRLLRAYHYEIPADFEEGLKTMLHLLVKVMRPNTCLPNLNDGSGMAIKGYVKGFLDVLPDDPVLNWVAGTEGFTEEPAEKSLVLPYSGLAFFRTGWSRKDTWLCFDGGPFGKNHQHEDKLHLLFHAADALVLTDANNYAYDSSEMRKYVKSTRAHNTVMVDGMGQNRRKGYHWEPEMLHTHSGLETKLSDFADYARAVYDEGYGEEQDKTVTHERAVYFIKKLDGFRPFAIVADRLTAAEGTHDYQVLWHLDAREFSQQGLRIRGDSLHLIVDDAQPSQAGVCVEYGVQYPQWNGWTANSARQLDYRPVYGVKYQLHGGNVRWVTVLYPCVEEPCPILRIRASDDVSDTDITIETTDGTRIRLDEGTLGREENA